MITVQWWSLHTHSKYSAKDALPSVAGIVGRAQELSYPAVGLTDHGTVAGIAKLYTECRKRDVLPVPGIEAYVVLNRHDPAERTRNMHACIVATSQQGWFNLINVANQSHRQFWRRPIIDLNDLSVLSARGQLDGLTITTGCLSGMPATALRSPDPTSAHNVLTTLTTVFSGRVMVELQHHNISDEFHDDDLHNQVLLGLADMHGLPVITTSDSHYLMANDRDDHEMLKRLMSWSDEPDSAVFSGDGYWLPSHTDMLTRFPPSIHRRAEAGLEHLLDGYSLTVPALDNFQLQVPDLGYQNPDTVLLERCYQALDDKRLKDKYRQRLDDELEVIMAAGFSSYMMLVARICDQMRNTGVMFDARGSAAGSLTCWLLGITGVDPLKYGLRFDRFLSGDRQKPPDIDLDVDWNKRQDVLEWLNTEFSMAHIATWRSLGMDDGEDKGSLLVKWKSMRGKTGQPTTPTQEETDALVSLSRHDAFDGTGVHPAGVVVVSDDTTLNQLPLQRARNSDRLVTAFDGKDIESLGLVKIDLLGLRTTAIIQQCCDTSGVRVEDIPWRDAPTFNRISRGRTQSMFQLSGWALRRGCMDIKPRTFKDLTATVALIRPATLNSDQTAAFIARRRGQQKLPQRHQLLMDVTKETYGILLYQEQILEVIRTIGMSGDEVAAVLKAVKASNANTADAKLRMQELSQRVEELSASYGFTKSDTEFLFNALLGYSDYGFNKSHAVAYARTAFVTAWLQVHYSVHWWAAVMSNCSTDSYHDNLTAARESSVSILPPHVNHSRVGWVPDPASQGIRKGLISIHGIGETAAKEIAAHAPYTSVEDLVLRTNRRIVNGGGMWMRTKDVRSSNGVLRKLAESGALAGLPEREVE